MKKVEGEVVAEAKKVEAAVEKVVEKVTQELSAEEKLAIREIENSYLKAQIEINRLSGITQKAQSRFHQDRRRSDQEVRCGPRYVDFRQRGTYFPQEVGKTCLTQMRKIKGRRGQKPR